MHAIRWVIVVGLSFGVLACTPRPTPPAVAPSLVQPPARTAEVALVATNPPQEALSPSGSALAVGREFACALEHVPGRVLCWGSNRRRQLGDGSVVSRATASAVSGISDAVEVTAGGDHACARTASGEVYCWGDGKPMVRVDVPSGVARVVASAERTCVINGSGGVACWGIGRWVPDPHNPNALTTEGRSDSPQAVPGLSAVVDIALGFNHTCVREASGAVRCLGASAQGELGNASMLGQGYVERPVDVDRLRDARAIGAGQGFTCAIRASGRVACWGRNYRGSLGEGPEVGHPTPQDIAGVEGAVALTVSDDHACALIQDGTMRCWGNNDSGKLGGAAPGVNARMVDNIRDATDVAVGPWSSCARRRAGGVACWGLNTRGQLGNGELPGVADPLRLEGIADAKDVALTQYTTCVLRAGGVVTCVGSAHGASGPSSRLDVTGLGSTAQITAAEYYTCALSTAGDIRCWGLVDAGPPLLRVASAGQFTYPPAVAKLPAARMVAAGGGGTCALLRTGEITCWGDQGARTRAPTPVAALVPDIVQIEQGALWGCAVQKSGHLVCWGLGYGEAEPQRRNLMSPVEVPGISDALHVSVGTNHACIVRRSGAVACFGLSDHMGISKGAGVKDVEGVAGVVHVSAGMAHSCVATRVGEVWCWGWNDDGELGTHGPGSQVPERVPGVSGVVKVAVGAHHSCAIDAAHSVFCWGRNMEGQISTITPGARATPVAVIGIGPPP